MMYLEVRTAAIELLDKLDEIQSGYAAIVDARPNNMARELNGYISSNQIPLREALGTIQTDADLGNVIASESALEKRYQSAETFWRALVESNAIDEFRDLREIQTKMPPEPPTEITGESIMAFLIEMQHWAINAAGDLWSEDNHTLEFPKLGDRFALGDFAQLKLIVDAFDTTHTLRHHWLRMSSLGDYWDSPNVGASRSKLIHLAIGVIRTIITPPEGSVILASQSL